MDLQRLQTLARPNNPGARNIPHRNWSHSPHPRASPEGVQARSCTRQCLLERSQSTLIARRERDEHMDLLTFVANEPKRPSGAHTAISHSISTIATGNGLHRGHELLSVEWADKGPRGSQTGARFATTIQTFHMTCLPLHQRRTLPMRCASQRRSRGPSAPRHARCTAKP